MSALDKVRWVELFVGMDQPMPAEKLNRVIAEENARGFRLRSVVAASERKLCLVFARETAA